ncbi:hypothetical protein [Streptomyces sp. NPDC004728]|uniref:hypothetical protein n=1 Tax=Streptomyces sp. NPDC004728 TaxID=3154289 RepID=UPI0033B833C5
MVAHGQACPADPSRAGKRATLIVPVFPGPGEEPDEMVTSDAYKTLSRAVRARWPRHGGRHCGWATWLDNVRERAHKLTEQRRADLDALGMRW